MTKRMIDADALMKCVDSLYARVQTPNKGDYSLFMISKDPEVSNIFMNCLDVLVREIKALAKPAPEPHAQESIFDIDKWKKHLNINGHEGLLYKILFNNKKTLEIMPSCYTGQKYLNAFSDDNFNPLSNTFHRDIFICLDLNVNDFLCKKQESIFDADGWCWDFKKFKNYYSEHGFLIKTIDGYTTIRSGEQYRLCLKGVVAWRPLPTIPTGGLDVHNS